MKTHRFTTFPTEGLRFLRSLKRNNNREWFQEHKSIYQEVIKDPMTKLILALAADFEQFAPELVASPTTSLYRIYRDTRFSKDKTPYKTHVAAVFPRKGLAKHEGAGLYLHIAPTEVLIGGGVYMPLPEDLHAIRAYVAEKPDSFKSIVESSGFKKMFGELGGERLTRVPRGFSPTHPAADYLRHKQYLAGRTLPAAAATSRGFYKTVVETFQTMMPFVRFLNEPVLRLHRQRERQAALLKH
jgi:uncharacterized protein (TIGR02453 family)